MFDQTSPTTCVQQVPQNTPTTLAIGDIIRWPLASNSNAIALIVDAESIAGRAYKDAVGRFLGEELPHRFLDRPRCLF